MIDDSDEWSTLDTFPSDERSRIMSSVQSKDTSPELVVRRLIHGLGYRYRLHARELPGSPDLVFPSRGAVIFVSGCFWHRHTCANGLRLPRTKRGWWRKKLEGNRRRDAKQQRKLRRSGWKVMVIWECQTKDLARLSTRVRGFLG